MKYSIIPILGLLLSTKGISQGASIITSITITQISHNLNHHIPRLYIMREVKDFRNSNEDSICLLTDEEGFDKFANYISENNTNKKFNKQTRYEYGSYKIILKNKDGEVLVYVIDDNYESIYFLRRMKEYIRLNNLDINLSKKIEYIIPNSKESGLK